MSIDIIVPAKNEEENIELIFKEIRKKLRNKKHNIIFVDDGSTDNTFKKMRHLALTNRNVRVLSFTRNFGKDAAIYAGFKYSTSDYVAIIDADLQQDPKYIVEMLEFLEKNSDYDIVTMVNDYSKSKKIQRFMKKCFYKIMENNTGQNYEIGASDFRVMRRNVVKAMLEITEKNRFTKGLFSYLGFKQHSISYVPNKRQAGKSKFNLINQFRYALKGIISFSILPLSKKLSEPAMKLHNELSKSFMCDYDETGSIGKRYRREDEIGTPYCITVDFDTLEDNQVTIRDRDTMEQVRIPISEVENWLKEKTQF